MEKLWKNHGKTMEKLWKNYGKTMEKLRKRFFAVTVTKIIFVGAVAISISVFVSPQKIGLAEKSFSSKISYFNACFALQ
ncbi:MAG: hypothetical protein ACRC9N_03600 [Aeromonas sp.]